MYDLKDCIKYKLLEVHLKGIPTKNILIHERLFILLDLYMSCARLHSILNIKRERIIFYWFRMSHKDI